MKNSRLRLKKFLAIFTAVTISTILLSSNPSIAEKDSDWGYGGANNSTLWGDISPEFKSCQLGQNQSPINIDSSESESVEETNIEFDYQPSHQYPSDPIH